MDLRGKGTVAPALIRFAPWLVRGGIAFGIAAVLFGWQRLVRLPEQLGSAPLRVHWGALAAHAVLAAIFVFTARPLFHGSPAPNEADLLAAAVVTSACGALLSLALAFLPLEVWRSAFRSLGPVVWVALAAAALAILGGYFAQRLWWPTSVATFYLVRWMLALVLPVVVSLPEQFQLGSERFQVVIDPGCSGYEGLALIFSFAAAWLWWFRREYRFPAAMLLVPGALISVFLLNSVRIAALILIGDAGAPGIALGGFHSQAGWISFNLVAIGFCLLSARIPWLQRNPAPRAEHVLEGNPVAPYLMPFLAILAAGMVAKSLSAGFEYLYPLRVVAAVAALWFFRRDYRSLDWRAGPAAAVAGVAVFALWVAFDRGTAAAMPAELAAMAPAWRIAWIAFRFVGTAVTVPIAEELAFRGFLYRRLISADFEAVSPRTFSWLALLVSSLVFGVMHGGQWLQGALAGAIYYFAYRHRGRLGDAAAAHALTNALLAGLVGVTGDWRWF